MQNKIELVIKISEEEYKCLLHKKQRYVGMTKYEIIIANGTPLPKGHGDLIDRRKLINDGIDKGFCDWYDEIKYADAIIEADKESEG